MAQWWVLDANLILDVVLFEFAEKAERAQKMKTQGSLRYIRSRLARDTLLGLCRRRHVVTTPLALAEVGMLARRELFPQIYAGDESYSWPFISTLDSKLRQLNASVESASRVDRKVVARFGPADANLVSLTREKGRDASLLTGDRTLANWCEDNEVGSHYFDPRQPTGP